MPVFGWLIQYYWWHGSHGPGILLEKLIGPWKWSFPWKLLEFVEIVLEFYLKVLEYWNYIRINRLERKRLNTLYKTSHLRKTHFKKRRSFCIWGQFSNFYSKCLSKRCLYGVPEMYCVASPLYRSVARGTLSTKAGWLRLNVTAKRLYTIISKNIHEPCYYHSVLFHV